MALIPQAITYRNETADATGTIGTLKNRDELIGVACHESHNLCSRAGRLGLTQPCIQRGELVVMGHSFVMSNCLPTFVRYAWLPNANLLNGN